MADEIPASSPSGHCAECQPNVKQPGGEFFRILPKWSKPAAALCTGIALRLVLPRGSRAAYDTVTSD